MYEISLEPTNFCNLTCDMCPWILQSRTKGNMEWDLYCKIMDDIASIGPIRKLHMQMLGESFLHPQMVEMINLAEGKANELHVNTNGIPFVKHSLRRKILDSNLGSLTFSINAHSRETYKMMQGRDLYDKCKSAFGLLLQEQQARREQGLPTGPKLLAKMVLCDKNRHEWDEFKTYWESRGAYKAIYKETMDWHGSLEEYKREHEEIPRWRCHYLWNNMTILWNGDVVPCCIDWDGEVVFGNAKDAHIMDIWLGPVATEFREKHLKHEYHPMCAGCDYWRYDQRFRKVDTGTDTREDNKFRSTPEESMSIK